MKGVFVMKNNDFDFIKSKFDNAEPEIPDSLDKDILKQRISTKDEHKIIKFEQKKNYFKPIISAVACFILILGVAVASNSDMFNSNKVPSFINYEELNSKATTLEQVQGSEGIGCETAKTIKYTEEQGVEKPNTIKSNNGYIYYAYTSSSFAENRNKIYIFKAEKENTSLIFIIDKFISDEAELEGIFVNENKLIVLASTETSTTTKIYNIDDKSNPVLISEFEQSGEYSEARMIDSKLYLVSNYDFSPDSTDNIPSIKQGNETSFVSSNNIAYFENVRTAQYAVISAIDANEGKLSEDIKAVLGGSAKIHCTKDYMYINEYIEGERYGEPEREVTAAMKLNLKKGRFTYASVEEVKQYSNNIVDIGESSYSGVLYDLGENMLSVGTDMVNAQDKLILFDKNLNETDRITFENEHILTNADCVEINVEKNIYAVPAYFADESGRSYGVITFEIKNNKINITNRFKNDDESLMYQGKCIIIGDYLYSFDINDNAPDNEKIKAFSYKY